MVLPGRRVLSPLRRACLHPAGAPAHGPPDRHAVAGGAVPPLRVRGVPAVGSQGQGRLRAGVRAVGGGGSRVEGRRTLIFPVPRASVPPGTCVKASFWVV